MPASTIQDVINAWNANCASHLAQPVKTSDNLNVLTVGSKFSDRASFDAHMPGLHRAICMALAPLVTPPENADFDDTLSTYLESPGFYS
jgi:hypothetical protein